MSPSATQQIYDRVKLISNTLSALESRRKIALDNAKIGVWEWNLINNVILWDRTMYEIYGVDENFKISYDAWEGLIHPDDQKVAAANKPKLLSPDTEKYSTAFRVKVNGKWVWSLAVAKKILDHSRKLVKLIGTNQLIDDDIKIGCVCELKN